MHPSRSCRYLSALLAGALLAGPGCMRQFIIPVDELRKLDGFGGPPGGKPSPGQTSGEWSMNATDGTVIPFTNTTSMRLVGPGVQGRFSHIQLTPTELEGVLIGNDEPLKIDLATVQFVQVEGIDTVSSLITLLTIVAAVPVLYFGFTGFARVDVQGQ